MAEHLIRASVTHAKGIDAFAASFAEHNPGYGLQRLACTGSMTLEPSRGTAFVWLARGQVSIDGAVLATGDVVVLDRQAIEVQGDGVLLRIDTPRSGQHAGLRRLADLPDTSGGCNVSAHAFRRLQVTWEPHAGSGDGTNTLGCHVVNMEAQFSRTHYHPAPARGGGRPQYEFYLVLDPVAHGLPPADGDSGVWTCPEPGDWEHLEFTALAPGDIVGIRAPAPHRGTDLLACVIAIPGFKPRNELYLDAQIAEDTKGQVPHNPAFA